MENSSTAGKWMNRAANSELDPINDDPGQRHDEKDQLDRPRPPTPHPEQGEALTGDGQLYTLPTGFAWRQPIKTHSAFPVVPSASGIKVKESRPRTGAATRPRYSMGRDRIPSHSRLRFETFAQGTLSTRVQSIATTSTLRSRTFTLPFRLRVDKPQSTHQDTKPATPVNIVCNKEKTTGHQVPGAEEEQVDTTMDGQLHESSI